MKLQSFLSRGQQSRAEQSSDVPRPVLTAVKVMYAGAVLSAIQLTLALVTAGSLRNAIRKAYPSYTASHIHSVEVSFIASEVITQLLAIGLWVLLAQASRKGMRWARAVASGLFAFNTFLLLTIIRQPSITAPLVLDVLVWVAGLGAVALLWQRDSSAFFTATTQARRSSM